VKTPRVPALAVGLAALVAAPLAGAGAAPEGAKAFSLGEAVDYALAHNPRVREVEAARVSPKKSTADGGSPH
jgi:hypothetical protein